MTVINLSRLLELRVEEEGGRNLGHVHDVRVRQHGEREYVVEGLLVGRRGLLDRLGWRTARDPIPWDDVVALEDDRLIVRRR